MPLHCNQVKNQEEVDKNISRYTQRRELIRNNQYILLYMNEQNRNSFMAQSNTIRQINAACDPSCKTCSGPPPNNCITCTDTSKFLSAKMNNSCVASCAASEFADTSNPQQKKCTQCSSACQTCNGPLDSNCLICAQGYYSQLSTKKCVSSCDPSEFLNSQQQCQKCDPSCATCSQSGQSGCLTCNKDTYYYNGMCVSICPNGYQINQKTLTCDYCSNIRNPACNSCFSSCQLCTQAQVQTQKCTSCYSDTRTLDASQNCACKNPKDQRNNFYLCSFQNIANLDVQLSGTNPLLTIDFGSPLKTIASTDYSPLSLCQYLFDKATMILLGADSSCQITGSTIKINLGDSSTIQENHFIYFQPNKLSFLDYANIKIDTFYRNFVVQIPPAGDPQLQFAYNEIENSCNTLNITLTGILNDAGRKFSSFNWTLVKVSGVLTGKQQQDMNQIFQKATLSQSTSLIIDPLVAPSNQNITIQFNAILKINKTVSQKITVFYAKQKFFQVSHLQSVYAPIYKFMGLSFYFQYYIQYCDLGKVFYFYEPVDLKLVPGNLKQQTISKYNQSSFQYDIPPYTLESNQQFQVNLTLTLSSDNKISTLYSALVTIETSNLFLQMVGGINQIANYKKQLLVSTLFRDYEIKDPTAPQKIDFTWTCQSLSSKDNICYDQSNKQIQLPQGSSNITLPEKTFQPYTAVKLIVKGQSGSRSSTTKTTCFFNELDIPPVQVSYTTAKQNKRINLNELLTFMVSYDPNVPSDVLSYSAAVLYQEKVVGNVKFDYQQVKFRIWDYFKNIDPSESNIYIRFSVYNPLNSMQSLSTINFQVNPPPKNCTFTVNPQQGIALQTVFTLQFLYCIDDDLPLTYQFFYYNSADDLQNELTSPWNIVRRQLQDQTISNSIQTMLPQGNLVIMGQAMDSQLGIFNSTVSIQVQSQNKSADDYYGAIKQLINQTLQTQSQSLTTSQLVALSVIGDDVSKNTQFNFSQQMSDQQSLLITNIQQISLQLPAFSLLSNFANKMIAQLTQLVFNSQQLNQNTLKTEIIKLLQQKIQDTQQSIVSNNINFLWQNNDFLIQNLIDCFKILNSTVTLNQQNQVDDFQNYNIISNQIGVLLSTFNQPNQGQIVLNGIFSTLLFDKITQKNMYQYGLSAIQSNSEISTNIYSVSRNNYKFNVYENSTGFQTYAQLFKNVDKNFTYSKNQIISLQVNSSNPFNNSTPQALLSNQTLIYEFNNAVSSSKYNMTCLQQNDSAWSKKGCHIVKKNSTSFICFCNAQSPTTIIEDINDVILQNQKQPEQEEIGPLNYSYFQELYLYLNLQVLFGVTFLQIILIIIGKCLDRKSFLQQYLQVQQDAPENALKNKQTQKSQEIPEIEDFNEPYLTPSNQIKIDSNELDVKQNKGKNEIFFYQPKTSVNMIETQYDQDRQKQQTKFQNISFIKKLAIFHSFFSIFYIYYENISRSIRFTLIYIKIIHTLLISIILYDYSLIPNQIIIAFVNSFVLQLSSFLISLMFNKCSFENTTQAFFQLSAIVSYYYFILILSGGKSQSESSEFLSLFLASIIAEFFIIEFLLSIFKNILTYKYLSTNNQNSIYYKLFTLFDYKSTFSGLKI